MFFRTILCATICFFIGITRAPAGQKESMDAKREQMLQQQIIARGIIDQAVLRAMRAVERHLFVDEFHRDAAYEDHPLPIGSGQTISQPYIVAFMTEALGLKKTDRVLEIGTGCGYQAAVLAEIVSHVYTIELLEDLAADAQKRFTGLGYKNISVKCADGYNGWPQQAPFDAIMVTAAPTQIPPKLIAQLKVGGRMIVPVGELSQELLLITKTATGNEIQHLLPVRFVPMVHREENDRNHPTQKPDITDSR